LVKEKAEKKIPGISDRLDEEYRDYGGYNWNTDLSSRAVVVVLVCACKVRRIEEPLEKDINDMREWNALKETRNRAAHNMVAITDDDIRKNYTRKSSDSLIKSIETVLTHVSKNSLQRDKHDIFRIYDDLNEMIIDELKQ